MELFKKSFTLYVESGMRQKTEADIQVIITDIWKNERGNFKEKFSNFIIEHYLCKFLCFYLHSTYLVTTFIHINTAHPGESDIGDQLELEVSELEQQHEKKLSPLKKLMLKIRSGLGQRV